MANNGSLSVVLCKEHIAATSGTVIYLQRPKYDWDKDRLCIWESDAYHEIGHCAPNNKDIFDIIHKHEIHMASRFGKCLNCLDDLRQEWEQYGKFRGRDRIMGEGNMLCFKGHVDKNRYQNPDKDDGVKFITILMGYMTYVFQWYPAMAGRYDSMLKATEPEARKMIEKLVKHNEEINPLGCNGQEVYERSKRMLELMGFDPDKEEEDAKDQKKAEEQLSEIAKEFAKEIFKHFHTDRDIKEHATGIPCAGLGRPDARYKESKEKLSVNVEIPPDYEGYIPSNWDNMQLTDYSVNPADTTPDQKTRKLVEKGMFLGTHIRKLLQTMSQTRIVHGLKRGKLAGKNAYRVTMQETGEYQRKVFKKKDNQLSLDVAISLVVDGSGSMNRINKYEAASAAAVIMSSVLTQLRIKHEIIVFTEVSPTVPILRHGIIKSFMKATASEQLMRNFEHFRKQGMSQNLDGESIMWSAMRLLKVDSARKIMIVFSDGQPSAYREGAAKITTDAIKELEARRDMEIYGIGILTDSVKRYYKEYKVIGDIDELEKSLLSVIKSKIINK